MGNDASGKVGKTARISDIIVLILFAILFLVSALLSFSSLLATTVLLDYEEHIAIVRDNVLLNIAVLAAFMLLLKYLKRFFKNINPKTALIALVVYTSVLGIGWVVLANSSPRSDQLDIVRNLQKILNNDFSEIGSRPDAYLQLYPFQLGIVFVFEMLWRVFGSGNLLALAIINVVWLDLAYIAIVYLVKRIFNNPKIELLTILLLFACLQPILFCTFLYGNLMGLAFSLWAVYFVIKFIQTGKKSAVLICAVLITVAMLAKFNCSIELIAMCIVLLLHFIKNRGWFSLVAIAIATVMSLGTFGLVQKSYEWRSNIPIGGGIPQTAWLEMGLQQDSPRYVGWYNGYNYVVYRESGFNTDAATAQIQKDIKNSIDYFLSNGKYAVSFFAHKAISQWDEPTFESISISRGAEPVKPRMDWVNNMYSGNLKGAVTQYFDYYMEIIYLGFAAAMFFAIRKKAGLCFLIIPLAILGGFTYHMFFEAKSQYSLVYFIMMIPFAAYGYYQLVNIQFRKWEGKKDAG